MDTGALFVGAMVVGMVIAIIAFSIRKNSRNAGVSERTDAAGSQGIDPGIAYLMAPGAMSDGSSLARSGGHSAHHAPGHQAPGHHDAGHHGNHAHDGGHDHGSHASFDSCAPVDSGNFSTLHLDI